MDGPAMNRNKGSSLDKISNLPDNLIGSILCRLSLRDAVRTSVLSSTWKDKWVTLPHLIFNENTFKDVSVKPPTVMADEVIKVISQILLQHSGPVFYFMLSTRYLRSCPSIDHWFSFLSRNGITYLTLEIQTIQPHKLPSSIFSCQYLKQLNLLNCIVRPPPPTFTGFKKLTKMVFRRVLCSATSLENIIVNSPILKELILQEVVDLHPLNITSPSLELFYFRAKDLSLFSVNAPSLLTLSMFVWQHSYDHAKRYASSNLLDLIGLLPGTIRRLEMNSYTSQFLEVDNLKNLPSTFSDLSSILLASFSFEDLEPVACALCLIRNSPNLNTIQINIQTPRRPSLAVEHVLTLMGANLGLSVNVKKLLFVTITSIGGTKPEMEFIKFMLANSPVLRTVTIKADKSYPSYDGSKTLKELVGFTRASSVAQIMYSD